MPAISWRLTSLATSGLSTVFQSTVPSGVRCWSMRCWVPRASQSSHAVVARSSMERISATVRSPRAAFSSYFPAAVCTNIVLQNTLYLRMQLSSG